MSEPSSIMNMPLECLHEVFSYMSGPLSGMADTTGVREYKRQDAMQAIPRHPYDCLAATCHYMRAAIEGYSRHLVTKHEVVSGIPATRVPDGYLDVGGNEDEAETHVGPVTNPRPRISWMRGRAVPTFKPYRRVWMNWTRSKCAFCSRATQRRATFNNMVRCCRVCDDVHWPNKIRLGQACRMYHLTKDQLMKPISPKYKVRYAIHERSTIFLRKEVAQLRELLLEDGMMKKWQLHPVGPRVFKKTSDGSGDSATLFSAV